MKMTIRDGGKINAQPSGCIVSVSGDNSNISKSRTSNKINNRTREVRLEKSTHVKTNH